MLLTIEEHPEAIRRYAHVARAGGWGSSVCGSGLEGTARTCTRPRGHSGPHVAHGSWRKVLAVWDGAGGGAAPRVSPRSGRPAPSGRAPRRPVGLPSRPRGLVQLLRDALTRALSSAEEIAFLVFFLAFVGFALHWLWLILG